MSEMSPGSEKRLVRARNVGVRRSNRWIVRYVDVDLDRGAQVLVVGANGSGKSTLIKAILGLIEPDEGTINRIPDLSVGYVPQRLVINPTLPLTLRRLMTLTGRFTDDEINEALDSVGLGRLGNPPVSTLSGGEFQRLLLARALIHHPDLLVLDEPDQGVDVNGAERLYTLIRAIRNNYGCGILIISHNAKTVMEFSDDFVVLVPHEHDEDDVHGPFDAGNLPGHRPGRHTAGNRMW